MLASELQRIAEQEKIEAFVLRAMLFDGLAVAAVATEIFNLEIRQLTSRMENFLA